MQKMLITEKEKQHRTNVRFTASEFKRVQSASKALGITEAAVLRSSFLDELPINVLVNQKDLQVLRSDLSKIGNNLNQVARKLNAGFMHGWNDLFENVYEEFKILTAQIHHGYGIHKS